MKKLYIIILAAAVILTGCNTKKEAWGDPGEISDIHTEGVEYGVKVIFTAPVDHEDYYYTLISYENPDGKPAKLRVSRYDADAAGVTEALVEGLTEIMEYSFTAKPYSFGGVGGNVLSVSGTPISPEQVGYLLLNENTASSGTKISKTGAFEYHIETTGLDPEKDAVVEIGAVKVRDYQEVSSFNVLIRCGTPLPATVSTVPVPSPNVSCTSVRKTSGNGCSLG